MNILIKLSGSIAAYKICHVISALSKEGHEVKVVASGSALKFIGEATLEALSKNEVFTDDFKPGKRLDHIYLNDWADLVILAPASAQTINAITSGVGNSPIVTTFLSRKKEIPYLIFPAMNPRMWESERLKESIKYLSSLLNVNIHNPSKGVMACGHEGEGRLSEPNEILDVIYDFIQRTFKKRILISLGGAFESIDGVREISNFSSGRTGLEFIKSLRNNFKIDVLASEKTRDLLRNEYGFSVSYFKGVLDLEEKMKKVISENKYARVFHLAAVSDYIVTHESSEKISSDKENLEIRMKKAPKILSQLRDWSLNKEIEIISFKLSHNEGDEIILKKIQNQFQKSSSDMIVHNELSGINNGQHEFNIYSKNLELIKKGRTKAELVDFFNFKETEGL